MLLTEIPLKEIVQDCLGQPEGRVSISLMQLQPQQEGIVYHSTERGYPFYPASLIKLFHAFFAKVRLQDQIPELMTDRNPSSTEFGKPTHLNDVYDAIHAALKISDNDALGFLMDFNSNTSSGPRLNTEDFLVFRKARSIISELFQMRNYSKELKLHNKCFSFAPYGRDAQLACEDEGWGPNQMIIEDVMRCMLDIRAEFPELYQPLVRKIGDESDMQAQFIAKGFIGHQDQIKEFYSKAGWTSKVRHDTALFALKNGQEYLLTILTAGLSDREDLVADLAREVVVRIL